VEVSGDSRDRLSRFLVRLQPRGNYRKFTVTTIDMSSVMRKQVRVIEEVTSQSLTPVMYSYSVSAASTGSALPPKGFSGFENSDVFGSLSASLVLSETTPGCLSSFPIVGEVSRGVVWRLSPSGKWEIQPTMKPILVSSRDIETVQDDRQMCVASRRVPLVLTLVPAIMTKNPVGFRIFRFSGLTEACAHMPSEFLMIYNYKDCLPG
jgi:hypothetical protein